MILHIKAVEAKDVPKMDLIGKCDPFLCFRTNLSSQEWKTKVIKKTYTPEWNEEFHIPITSNMDELLHIELYDQDTFTKNDLISTRDFPVNDFQIGQVTDEWYDFAPAPKIPKGGKVRLIFHLANSGDEAFIASKASPYKARDVSDFDDSEVAGGDLQRYDEYPETSHPPNALRNITKQIKSKSNGSLNPINFCYVDRLISVRGFTRPIAISLQPSTTKLSSYGVYIYDTTRLQDDKALYLFVGPDAQAKTEKFGQDLLSMMANETKCTNIIKIIRNTNSPDFQNMIQKMGGSQKTLDKSKNYGDELNFQLNFFSTQFHNQNILGDTIAPNTKLNFNNLPPKCVDIIDTGDFTLYFYVDNANPSSDAERTTQLNAINYICKKREFKNREVIVFDKSCIPSTVKILCSK